MKKIVITLLAVILVGQAACAQSFDSLYNRYKQEENADAMNLSPFMMAIINLLRDKEERNEIEGKLNSIKMLNMEECPAEVKERFAKDAARVKFKGYEELLRMKDDEDNARVLMKQKDNVIRELVILISGEDCALIRLKCKIKPSDIEKMIKVTFDD